jgi:hypothetical protein
MRQRARRFLCHLEVTEIRLFVILKQARSAPLKDLGRAYASNVTSARKCRLRGRHAFAVTIRMLK